METEIVTAYIGLGSNEGFRTGNILLAVRGLMEAGFHVSRLSAIYETDPVEVEGHEKYLNMVAEVFVTNVSPTQMLARMVRIEYLLGRRHKYLLAPRTIDLDLLLYGDAIIESEFLTLPHPRMHLRKFVLVPMAELAPDLIHPGENKSMSEILEALNDDSKVERWNPDPKSRSGDVAIAESHAG
ncbi:MAG: 2-amino-4-hydroxy-6-hydroxymethyldihydropteridine diphosphokinase [Pyrinomonadaceae bacterium]